MIQSTFSDDLPKNNPWTEDRLGYRPFAERLSRAVLDLEASNGYVIGLQGPWGSGKSTALNFVSAFLKKFNDEQKDGNPLVQIVEYRPWIISGHQNLVSGFFKVLSEALVDGVEKRQRAKRWILGSARTTLDPAVSLAAAISLALGPASGAIAKAGSVVVGKSASAAIERILSEPSLQTLYDRLRARLIAADKRFLVTIDDIDRLDRDEIRTIMQMVKTVGRLPNVIYLLAYDRRIVWDALDSYAPRQPGQPSFAEKIVQHELELPTPTRSALMRVLDQEIKFIAGPTPDGLRWYQILQSGLYRWIRNPRDVYRLSNALKFAWPALKGEIDPQDLIVMEAMRLFDQNIFDWVRQSRDFLMREGRYRIDGTERSKAGEALRASLPAQSRDAQLRVLCTLFPTRSEAILGEDRWESNEPYYELIKRRGIATEAGYDAYFSLHPSPNAVPKATLDSAVQNLEVESLQLSYIKDVLGRTDEHGIPMLSEYLEEMHSRFLGANAANPTAALLNAIFTSSDNILRLDWRVSLFSSSPRRLLLQLVKEMMKIWGPDAATAALENAFHTIDAPTLSAEIWIDQARALGVLSMEGNPDRPFISKSNLAALGVKLLNSIERLANTESLSTAPFYFNIARAWSHLGGNDAPRQWLLSGIEEDPHFLATVSRGYLGYSSDGISRTYSYSEWQSDSLLDVASLVRALERHRGAPILSNDENARIEALLTGLTRTPDEPIEDG